MLQMLKEVGYEKWEQIIASSPAVLITSIKAESGFRVVFRLKWADEKGSNKPTGLEKPEQKLEE